jgi:hypothetical protein
MTEHLYTLSQIDELREALCEHHRCKIGYYDCKHPQTVAFIEEQVRTAMMAGLYAKDFLRRMRGI